MEQPDDRRDATRLPIELKVEYKKVNAFLFDYTHNISKGGTFIKTSRPLAVDTEFTFKLIVPGLGEPLMLAGRVRWVIDEGAVGGDDPSREPGMGIQFIYRDDEERRRLSTAVERLMVRELGERAYNELMGS
jgi:type IV pilus assembly protein PilZ